MFYVVFVFVLVVAVDDDLAFDVAFDTNAVVEVVLLLLFFALAVVVVVLLL